MKAYLKLIRISHWIKNILVLLPLVFSGNLLNADLLKTSLLGALIFSLISSAVYVINDICDVEFDKKHPVKCKRPLASGEITLFQAKLLLALLSVLSVGLMIFMAFSAKPGGVNGLLGFACLVFYAQYSVQHCAEKQAAG